MNKPGLSPRIGHMSESRGATPMLRRFQPLRVPWGLYACSLFLSALLFAEHDPLTGFDLLCWGWWGFILLNFAWLANPLFLVASLLLVFGRLTLAAMCSSAALLLSLYSFAADEWWFNEASGTPIEGFGLGFWFWLLSLVSLVAICFTRLFKERLRPDSELPHPSD